MNLFGDIKPFLEVAEDVDVGPATRVKMQAILDDPKKKAVRIGYFY